MVTQTLIKQFRSCFKAFSLEQELICAQRVSNKTREDLSERFILFRGRLIMQLNSIYEETF